jgi:hypothetical protein
MSDKEPQELPVATEPVTKPLGIGTPQPGSIRRRTSRTKSLPVELVTDIVALARTLRERHELLFFADRKLKDRAARLFRTVLPPRPGRPGRKRIANVTLAIRLQRRLKLENPTARPDKIWAKVYPMAIPNYATLTNEARWIEQRRLRDRVHSRKRQQKRSQELKLPT